MHCVQTPRKVVHILGNPCFHKRIEVFPQSGTENMRTEFKLLEILAEMNRGGHEDNNKPIPSIHHPGINP